jgi:hypothetical protein
VKELEAHLRRVFWLQRQRGARELLQGIEVWLCGNASSLRILNRRAIA